QSVVGVNRYRPDTADEIPVLKVDNTAVREQQLAKLARLKAERDPAATTAALEALTNGAAGGGNLLELSVNAARAKATVGETAAQAVADGVHAVGASSLAAGHLTLVPELKAELAKLGRKDIMVVVGGVIPPEDFAALKDMGVAAIFTPGTTVPQAAISVIER